MPQQKGVKRAAKVATRKKKIEARKKEANIKKASRANVEHDHNEHKDEK